MFLMNIQLFSIWVKNMLLIISASIKVHYLQSKQLSISGPNGARGILQFVFVELYMINVLYNVYFYMIVSNYIQHVCVLCNMYAFIHIQYQCFPFLLNLHKISICILTNKRSFPYIFAKWQIWRYIPYIQLQPFS